MWLTTVKRANQIDGTVNWADGRTTELRENIYPCQGPACEHTTADAGAWMTLEFRGGQQVMVDFGDGTIGPPHGVWFQFCSPACIASWAAAFTERTPVA